MIVNGINVNEEHFNMKSYCFGCEELKMLRRQWCKECTIKYIEETGRDIS